jgi:hypothetical protein
VAEADFWLNNRAAYLLYLVRLDHLYQESRALLMMASPHYSRGRKTIDNR